MRTKLFISHATPADNEFAAWLAAKLELHGYDVWVDINELDPASDFWNTIETTIRENTVIFLFIATKTSVLGNRDGVKKELAVADRVRKKESANFIVPLRADDVSFDDFPVEILRQNTIDFCNDWATGLISLLDYLEKQGISKTNTTSEKVIQSLERWRDISSSRFSRIISRSDYYCSNLFPVRLPNNVYVYNDAIVEPFLVKNHKPRKKFGDSILTFVCPDCITNYCGYEVSSHALAVSTMLKSEKPVQVFNSEIKKTHSACVNLVNWTICDLFYQKGMRMYKPTDRTESRKRYFFKRGVKSKRHEKALRAKALSGSYKGKNWHYAQSAYFTTFPFEGILFRAHLLFTDSNDDTLPDAQQLTARRSKGKRFFNNDWRDMLQAAMYAHSNGEDEIMINLCCEQNRLIIKRRPYSFKADTGYVEPSTDPLDNTGGGFDDDYE